MRREVEETLDRKFCQVEGGHFCRFLRGPNTYSGYCCSYFTHPGSPARIHLKSKSSFPALDKVYRCRECLDKVTKIRVTEELL